MGEYRFLEEQDRSGKTVIPFSTSGGSRFSNSIAQIQSVQPDAEVLEDGLSVSHFKIEDYSYEQVVQWIESLHIVFNRNDILVMLRTISGRK